MSATHLSGPLFVGGVNTGQPFNVPHFDNKIFYVDPDNGSDSLDGLTPQTPFSTVEAGYAALRSNKHDVLVLSGNGSHTLSDELVITKNRIHIVGADHFLGRYYGQSAKVNLGVTTGTAISAINNQGVRNSFHGLKITSSDTLAASLYGVCEAGEFSYWEGCEILKTTDLDQTTAADMLMVGDSPLFRGCSFGNMIARASVARQNVLFSRSLSPTSNVARDVTFEDCLFMGFPSATTFVNIRATTNDIERLCLFRRCVFANKNGGATQALAFGIASALTDADVILMDCVVQNITDTAATSSRVYTNSVTPVNDGTETVEVATT